MPLIPDYAPSGNRLGKPEVGEQYLQNVAAIVGGNVRHYEKNRPDVVNADGRTVDATAVLAIAEQWKETKRRFINELRSSEYHGQ